MKMVKQNYMYSILAFLLMLIFTQELKAGTCTSDSYTSSSANAVLTSTKYNSDHSTIYDRLAGNLDGGCVSDGTLEDGALNTTDFAVVLNGIKDGCKVSFSDAATISIAKCRASVNGNFVRTTTATTATWGCSGCSSEANSTVYYAYIKDGSSGATLTPLISTTAPNDDGYDSSSNRVLARFYNDATGDIDTYSIDQWDGTQFVPQEMDWTAYTPGSNGFGTISGVDFLWKRSTTDICVRGLFQTGTTTASEGRINLPNSLVTPSDIIGSIEIVGEFQRGSAWVDGNPVIMIGASESYLKFAISSSTANYGSPLNGSDIGNSQNIILKACAPVTNYAY